MQIIEVKSMGYAALLSVTGAAVWYALYRLDRRQRIRKALRDGKPAELLPARVFWIVSGIAGQLFHYGFAVL